MRLLVARSTVAYLKIRRRHSHRTRQETGKLFVVSGPDTILRWVLFGLLLHRLAYAVILEAPVNVRLRLCAYIVGYTREPQDNRG